MKYKAVLIDADDTILDFEAAEEKALTLLLDHLKLPETASAEYRRINRECWKAFEAGTMTQPQLRLARFERFCAACAPSVLPESAAKFYESALAQQGDILPNAAVVLRKISEELPISVITNGITEIQHSRMRASGLLPFIKRVYISEETGFPKPNPGMILLAMEDFGITDPSQAIMIGDSAASDMGAARSAGVDFLWYNPKHKARPENSYITYETNNIMDFAKYALCK